MSVAPQAVPRRPWRLLLLLGLLVGVGLWFNHKGVSELPVYTTGAQRMLDGDEIYLTSDLKPFTYPPFFALPFVPLALLDAAWHRPLWAAVNVLLMWWLLGMLQRFVAPALASRRQAVVLWVIVAALAARHVAAIFENQSHDLLVLVCVCAAALAFARGAVARAGAWAGLGAACKATPALFGLTFLLQLRFAAMLAAGVVGLAATLLPDVLLPRDDGRLWVEAWLGTMVASVRPGQSADLQGTWAAGSILNQSLAGTLYRLTTPLPPGSSSPWLVEACVCELGAGARRALALCAQSGVVAMLALSAWAARRAPSSRDDRAVVWARLSHAAAVACGMVLLSPMSSKSHFGVLLLPALAAALLWVRGCRDLLLAACGVGVFALGTLSTKGLLGSARGNWLLAHGSVTFTAVLGLLLAWRAQVLWRRQAS